MGEVFPNDRLIRLRTVFNPETRKAVWNCQQMRKYRRGVWRQEGRQQLQAAGCHWVAARLPSDRCARSLTENAQDCWKSVRLAQKSVKDGAAVAGCC